MLGGAYVVERVTRWLPQSLGPSAADFGPGVPHRHVAYFDAASGAVPNPGMGVMAYAHSDHMYDVVEQRREPKSPSPALIDALGALPHSDILYLRVEWRDVQQRAGQLSLPPVLQHTLDAVEKHGKRWALRVMPINPQSRHPRSTPAFLDDVLQFAPYPEAEYGPPLTKFFPVYGDRYVEAWRELMFLLAERFDGDPRLDFVDISGFGKWGEWHHWPQTDFERAEVEPFARRIAEAHLDAFQQTAAVAVMTPGPGWKDHLLDLLLARGAGVRRDSFYPLFTPWECRVAQQARAAGRPFVFESGFFPDDCLQNGAAPRITYAETFQRMIDFGATHVNLGFNPWHAFRTHEQHAAALQAVASQIGYRIRPTTVWLSRGRSGEATRLSLALTNDGSAPPPGQLVLHVNSRTGETREWELAAGTPAPQQLQLVEVPLSGEGAELQPPFKLRLSIRLGKKRLAVRWAVASGQALDNAQCLRVPTDPA